jgi:hypothetical protein
MKPGGHRPVLDLLEEVDRHRAIAVARVLARVLVAKALREIGLVQESPTCIPR